MMETLEIDVDGVTARGFVIPSGPFNIVGIQTDKGMVACAAFDVAVLDKFDYPAAAIAGVATCDDLLSGSILKVNKTAAALGIDEGMTGREALAKLV